MKTAQNIFDEISKELQTLFEKNEIFKNEIQIFTNDMEKVFNKIEDLLFFNTNNNKELLNKFLISTEYKKISLKIL